jgi:hypothetical protein
MRILAQSNLGNSSTLATEISLPLRTVSMAIQTFSGKKNSTLADWLSREKAKGITPP